MPGVDVLIMAAGTGSRFRDGEPKQFAVIAGRPMIVHSVGRFASVARVDRITLVVAPDQEDLARSVVAGFTFPKVARVVAGGETRQKSVFLGLKALDPDSEHVLIHDAARPCVTISLIEAVLDALSSCDAVIPAVPAVDTLVLSRDGYLDALLDRVDVSGVQTPQGFRTELALRAHRRAEARGISSSDDGSLVFALDERVRVIPGERTNVKVTYEEDVRVAEAVLGGV